MILACCAISESQRHIQRHNLEEVPCQAQHSTGNRNVDIICQFGNLLDVSMQISAPPRIGMATGDVLL